MAGLLPEIPGQQEGRRCVRGTLIHSLFMMHSNQCMQVCLLPNVVTSKQYRPLDVAQVL